jgi:hypothetical protein
LSLKANKSRSSLCSETARVAWLLTTLQPPELNQKKKRKQLCSFVLLLLNLIEIEIEVFTIPLAKLTFKKMDESTCVIHKTYITSASARFLS